MHLGTSQHIAVQTGHIVNAQQPAAASTSVLSLAQARQEATAMPLEDSSLGMQITNGRHNLGAHKRCQGRQEQVQDTP